MVPEVPSVPAVNRQKYGTCFDTLSMNGFRIVNSNPFVLSSSKDSENDITIPVETTER